HAERFVEVLSHGVAIHFPAPALLGANTGGEIAEMVDCQRDIRRAGFTDRLTVIPGFRRRQQFEVLLHTGGNLEQNRRPILNRSMRPLVGHLV
ncbi:hypothetical protein XU19_23925, partial [Vibrio parahaemolyticus]